MMSRVNYTYKSPHPSKGQITVRYGDPVNMDWSKHRKARARSDRFRSRVRSLPSFVSALPIKAIACYFLVMALLVFSVGSMNYFSPSAFIEFLQNSTSGYNIVKSIQRVIKVWDFSDIGNPSDFVFVLVATGLNYTLLLRDIGGTIAELSDFLNPTLFSRSQDSYDSPWEWSVPPAPASA